MTSRRAFLRTGSLALAGLALGKNALASMAPPEKTDYLSCRPELAKRNFTSKAVENVISRVKPMIGDRKIAWMFENCFPNTLDTTVEFAMKSGLPDTFVITGDIHAMWLRDSSAQVFPYIPYAKEDPQLSLLLEGVIRRQTACIKIDPYANAFNKEATGSEWVKDDTRMLPELHERKWEIDSLCYPIRLAYHYWKATGNTSVFDTEWKAAMQLIYKTFIEQQRKDGATPYTFTRQTSTPNDTLLNNGMGSPVNPIGLIVSSFRPSDDASIFGFLIPSNLFAAESLRQVAEISRSVTGDIVFAERCETLAREIMDAVQQYGIIEHPKFGKIYAYEVDGFGSHNLMDDANIPNLLALPYLCPSVKKSDPVYTNTRRMVWSKANPYFFEGKAASGIGGPHVGISYIWPMSLIIRALTSDNKEEIAYSLRTLRDTDAETGFIHESFHKDNPNNFTRKWFAWANTLFGELIIKVANEHKELLKNEL